MSRKKDKTGSKIGYWLLFSMFRLSNFFWLWFYIILIAKKVNVQRLLTGTAVYIPHFRLVSCVCRHMSEHPRTHQYPLVLQGYITGFIYFNFFLLYFTWGWWMNTHVDKWATVGMCGRVNEIADRLWQLHWHTGRWVEGWNALSGAVRGWAERHKCEEGGTDRIGGDEDQMESTCWQAGWWWLTTKRALVSERAPLPSRLAGGPEGTGVWQQECRRTNTSSSGWADWRVGRKERVFDSSWAGERTRHRVDEQTGMC